MADVETAKLPTVPETLLKKRKARSELRAKQIKAALLEKQNAKTKRATIFKRAEQYVKEYRKAEADELRLARDARKHGNFYVPSEAKLAIVMRIRGINGLHPRVRKVPQLLRLRQINNATFVKLNNFLWHFKLNNVRGGWRKKANHFTEGGDFGNREELVNRLLKKMI